MLNFLLEIPARFDIKSYAHMQQNIEAFYLQTLFCCMIIILLKHKKLDSEKLKLVKFHKNMFVFLWVICSGYIAYSMIFSSFTCVEPILELIIFFMLTLMLITAVVFSKKYIENSEIIIFVFNIFTIILTFLLVFYL